jgi:glycosyltransferase involved in cell wall biosynthesis
MKIFIDGSRRAAVSRMFPIWLSLGHEIVNEQKDADVQLSVVGITTKKRIPTILRVDGIYYDSEDDYNSRNNRINKSHQIADAIVYQSNSSKLMCEKYLDKRSTEIIDIIHNGIENWNNPIIHEGINIVSCAKWRRHKRLPEIVEVFKSFKLLYPNSKLHILGPMKRGASKIFLPDILYYDEVDENQIKEIYKTGDIHLHLCRRDSCPSSVVESISAGIPVVTTNDCGGATEMCKISENCFIVNGEVESLSPAPIYTDSYNTLNIKIIDDMVKCMDQIIKNKLTTKLPEQLTIEFVAKKYLKLMERII